MNKIRVLIVDDHAVLRSGLKMLINAQPDMVAVGEAADCVGALQQARQTNPDVISLDVTLPGGSGIRTIERLLHECPKARVLVLTMHDDPAYLRAALAAGAAGYVVKTAADAELLTAIRAVSSGRTFVDLDLAGDAQAILSSPGPSRPADSLSQREREVLTQLAHGHTNQEIADRLFLSVKTVETYRARIGTKLGLRSRADIVRYAMETGMLEGTNLNEHPQAPG